MNLNGTGTLVAGGASGLGEATARELAARGARVAILDLNEERGPQLAEELGGLFTPADVTSADEVAVALHDELGRVPMAEEIDQAFTLARVLYKAVLGLHYKRQEQKKHGQLAIF